MNKAKFYYFKASGKYYTQGEGETPATDEIWTREQLLACNNNHMPGLSTTGANFQVVIIPAPEAKYGWPQIIQTVG